MPSITRRRPPNPDRRASVEAQVLAATERLLADGASFTELGVQRIAAEAGVARSTFYTHFQDKSELLMRLAGTMQTANLDITTTWEPAAGPDALVEAFLRVLGVYREHAVVLTAINEVAAYDTSVRNFWRAGLNRFVEVTQRVLTAEQRAGRAPAEVDAVHASRVIVIGGEVAISDHVATFRDDASGDAAFAHELARIWWYGVYRRGLTTPEE